MKDFFGFRKMVTTGLIKLVYFLGFICITVGGIIFMFVDVLGEGGGIGVVSIVTGLIIVLFGNLIWRIACEGIILRFAMHSMLADIRKYLDKK